VDSTRSSDFAISNERLWSGPASTRKLTPSGCVRFTPVNSEPALYQSVWILTDAEFGCSNSNPVGLPGASGMEGRFHYYRSNFWVEGLSTGQALMVDDYELRQRDIVPLVNGAQLMITDRRFRVTVQS
jgi:hypothetical protein